MPKRNYSKVKRRSMSRSRSAYKQPRKKVRRNLGARIGRTLGQLSPYAPGIFAEVGDYLGNHLGNQIPSVFGHGDYMISPYKVNNNSLITPGDSPPKFGTDGRITRVRHREYIGDINGSNNFAITNYSLNPGLESTFPWLCSVAANYECYKVEGMLFEFKSMSGDSLTATNTALGSVIMATQYNAANSQFSSKQQMENYEFAQSCKPSQCMMHYIECAQRANPLQEQYVRTGVVPAGQSPQLYDLGTFSIATTGMPQTGTNIGELWVTYDITLQKPKLTQGQYGGGINYFHGTIGTQASATQPFYGLTQNAASNISMVNLGTSLYFPSSIVTGVYMVELIIYGSSGTVVIPTISTGANCSLIQCFYANTQTTSSWLSNQSFSVMIMVQITGPLAWLQYKNGTYPTVITTGDLFVTQLPSGSN